MKRFLNDQYQKSRGRSRLLDITCQHCSNHIVYYQKDGLGLLKRMYVDRFMDMGPKDKELKCLNCGSILGNLYVYKKESRPAYRLFVGAVHKKVVSQKLLNNL